MATAEQVGHNPPCWLLTNLASANH